MIKGALFDVDGTLLDSMSVWQQAFENFAKKYNLEVKLDAPSVLFSMSLAEASEFIRDEFHLPQSTSGIREEIADSARHLYLSTARLKPNVKNFLDALDAHKIPMAIVTSGERSLVTQICEHLGIARYFQHIFAATNDGVSKREPTLWLQGAELLEAHPCDIWVFEDALYALTVTNQLGFHTVGIEDAHSEASKKQIQSLADLYWGEYPSEIPPQMYA